MNIRMIKEVLFLAWVWSCPSVSRWISPEDHRRTNVEEWESLEKFYWRCCCAFIKQPVNASWVTSRQPIWKANQRKWRGDVISRMEGHGRTLSLQSRLNIEATKLVPTGERYAFTNNVSIILILPLGSNWHTNFNKGFVSLGFGKSHEWNRP